MMIEQQSQRSASPTGLALYHSGEENTMLKFFWNGIKDNGGKLQTCSYSDGQLCNFPSGTITIYKREYSAFSAGIRSAFSVTNDSEIQSDYMVSDIFRVTPEHPLYVDVARALQTMKAHNDKRWAKRTQKAA